MSDTDINIVAAFEQLQEFCRQSSLLLGSTKILMEKAGWTRASTNSTVFGNTSAALDDPLRWIPTYFCHLFRHKEMPQYLTFVSIIVGYPPRPSLVSRALISAGWLQFNQASPQQPNYWWARSHIWGAKPALDDGGLCIHELNKTWKKNDIPNELVSVVSFALPLSRVGTERELDVEILGRLLPAVTRDISAIRTIEMGVDNLRPSPTAGSEMPGQQVEEAPDQ